MQINNEHKIISVRDVAGDFYWELDNLRKSGDITLEQQHKVLDSLVGVLGRWIEYTLAQDDALTVIPSKRQGEQQS